MSYRRKYAGTKKRFGRAMALRSRGRAAAVARRRGRPRSYVGARGVGAAETHYFDTALATDVTSTASVNVVNCMAQGADFDERLGNKIRMRSLQIKFHVSNEVDLAKLRLPMRVMVVYDRQSNGAAPAITDVLDAATLESQKKIANRDRFWVLRDTVWHISTEGFDAAAVGQYEWYKELYVPLKGMETTFNAAAAGVGSCSTGALYVIYFNTIATPTGDLDMAGTVRLRYYA